MPTPEVHPPNSKPDRVALNLKMDSGLVYRLKTHALRCRITASDLVATLVERHLAESNSEVAGEDSTAAA